MNTLKKIVIIGAGSAIAKECARIWSAQSAVDLTLVGRNLADLEKLAQDLRVRNPQSTVEVSTTAFFDPVAIEAFVDALCARKPVDIVLIAHGVLLDQQECQDSLLKTNESLMVNGVSALLFAEGFAKNMNKAGFGTLAIIGSVAGDRGRKSNYIYGSAKAMVNTYVQGLQHRFAHTPIQVIIIKPGPTDTPMTAHLKERGAKLASTEQVASLIVNGIAAGRPVIYAPGIWRYIMGIIQHIPPFIFNKLNI